MSGRHARLFRAAQARIRQLADCDCGGGAGWPGNTIVIQCHAPGCAYLAAAVALSRRGFCSHCGYAYRQLRNAFSRRWWCPKGCEHGMETWGWR